MRTKHTRGCAARRERACRPARLRLSVSHSRLVLSAKNGVTGGDWASVGDGKQSKHVGAAAELTCFYRKCPSRWSAQRATVLQLFSAVLLPEMWVTCRRHLAAPTPFVRKNTSFRLSSERYELIHFMMQPGESTPLMMSARERTIYRCDA